MPAVKTLEILEGQFCPFVFCQRRGAHSHSVCPVCGAVRYGNMGCAECMRVRTQTNLIDVEDGRLEVSDAG